jgi:hypothetical protein
MPTRREELRAMPNRIHGRTLARLALPACLVAGLVAGCGTQPVARAAALPDDFSDPVHHPDFSSTTERASIEARLRRSRCGATSNDMTSLAFAGLNTRPETIGGVILDTGSTPDGTRWFLHRDVDDRELTYCGVALAGVGTGTNVAVTGVRHGDLAQVQAALESGDFFCTCRQLSK